MDRHDPLATLAPAPAPAPAPKPRRAAPRTGLLGVIAAIPDAMFAHLRPGRGPEARAGFIAFCEAQPHYTDWRKAWAAFDLARPIPATFGRKARFIPDVTPLPLPDHPVQTPAPLWLQHARQRRAVLA